MNSAPEQGMKFLSRISMSLRPFFIAFMALLFGIPLAMIGGVIEDRMDNRNTALESVMESWAGEQTVAGPVLIIPYTENKPVETFDTAKNRVVATTQKIERFQIIIPENLSIQTDLKTEERMRGIHKVPVFTGQVNLNGKFSSLGAAVEKLQSKKAEIGNPYVFIYVSDNRGLGSAPVLKWNASALNVHPGTTLTEVPSGFHAPMNLGDIKTGDTSFNIAFSLKGTKYFYAVPTGKSVRMTSTSTWPHPSFKGQYLPSKQNINEGGFTAEWETGLLATNIQQKIESCVNNSKCESLLGEVFGIEFYNPVDVYDQSMRAVKYGMLFVGLTFGIFYLVEIMRSLKVHVAQLFLVGGALAIFYLLLVSLSEHIGFGFAYLAASAATCGLLTLYVSTVLRERKSGLLVGGILTTLYAVLYGILRSEDYALLMGSVLLFLILAAAMYVTRNINWAETNRQEIP
jgi:inner membrane protein